MSYKNYKIKYRESALKYILLVTMLSISLIGCGGSDDTPTPSIKPSSIVISNEGTVEIGKILSLTATAIYDDGRTIDVTQQSEWLSVNPSIASVDLATGVVTGIGNGTTTVSATYNGVISAPAPVSVVNTPILQSIVISGTGNIETGKTQTLVAMGSYSDGKMLDITQSAMWTSSTPAVASVDKGLITALTEGATDIIASLNGIFSNVFAVTVSPIIACTDVTWIVDTNWAAFQDGPTGTWEKLVQQNGKFQFCVSDSLGRFGIAHYSKRLNDDQHASVDLNYSNLSSLSSNIIDNSSGNNTVNITVSGIALEDDVSLKMSSDQSANQNFGNIPKVKSGLNDLIGVIRNEDMDGNLIASRYYLERDIDITTPVTNITADFLGANSFDADTEKLITLEGFSGTEKSISSNVKFSSHNSTNINILDQNMLLSTIPNGSPVNFLWRGLPIGNVLSDEQYQFTTLISYLPPNDNILSALIYIDHSPNTNTTLTLSNIFDPNFIAWSFVTIGVNVTSKIDLTQHNDNTYGLPILHSVFIEQFRGALAVIWNINVDRSWLGTAENVTYQTPDLTGLAGWDSRVSITQGDLVALRYLSVHSDINIITEIENNTVPDGTKGYYKLITLSTIP